MDRSEQLSQKERFFVSKIVEWGAKNKRAFIWRERNNNFFIVFIAEFFLRRTKSETVDRFMREIFLKEFGTFCDLAQKVVALGAPPFLMLSVSKTAARIRLSKTLSLFNCLFAL